MVLPSMRVLLLDRDLTWVGTEAVHGLAEGALITRR